jgi:hypothetical protein
MSENATIKPAATSLGAPFETASNGQWEVVGPGVHAASFLAARTRRVGACVPREFYCWGGKNERRSKTRMFSAIFPSRIVKCSAAGAELTCPICG